MPTKLRKKAAKAKTPSASGPVKWVGQPIRRKEEDRLVRGKGIFVDDQKMTGMLHIRFVRSSYGHAKIVRLDVSKAAALPGVVCTLTGTEVKGLVKPFIEIGPDVGQKMGVRGEPVAAVVAETRLIAEDAADLVEVEYEPLPPVLSAEEALKDESLVHPEMGTNRNWHGVFEYGDVAKAFKQAAHVVHIVRLHFHRFSSTPLENNAMIAVWDSRSE